MIGDSGLADGDFINGGGEGFSAKLGELGWGGSRLVRKLLRFSFSVRRESRSFIKDCLFKTASSFSCFRCVPDGLRRCLFCMVGGWLTRT